MAEWKIKAAFKELHRPLSKQERRILEEEIVAHGGARDPISVWRSFVADGHNRYEICTEKNLPFTTVDLTERFGSQEEVEEWIIRNQLGKRNLTSEEFTYFVGKLYNAEKAEHGGDRKSEKSKGQNVPLIQASEQIAKETGVSEKTVKRAGKVAEAIDSMPKGLRESVLAGEVKATDKAKLAFAQAEPAKQQEAARAVRTGQAESLDAALGLKGPKPPKAEPAPKADRTSFNVEEIEKEQEEEKAKVKAKTPTKDGWGIPIQDHASAAFEAVPLFDELLSTLRKVKVLYADLAEKPGGAFLQRPGVSRNVNGRFRHDGLENLIAALEDSKPTYTVCPYEYHGEAIPESKHKHDKKCQLCHGLNWSRELGKQEQSEKVVSFIKEKFGV